MASKPSDVLHSAVPPLKSRIYYRHIDGMRALAVLAVIIFHLSRSWLPGGFVGVDVFFVISGYLITTILVKKQQDQSYRVSVFYMRRIRRIFPALFSMLIVTSIAGLMLFAFSDLAYFAKTLRYAALQISNILFQGTQSYFAPTNDSMPLLHTWSLGVEEQYYLVWPLILSLLFRRSKNIKQPMMGLIVLSILSFSVSVLWVANGSETRAFFSLLSRFWELGLGGILAMMPAKNAGKKINSLLGYLGCILVILSFVLTNHSFFPGLGALMPCVGAGLLILYGDRCFLRHLLEWRPVVFVGLISYSLYLWHWPMIIFYQYYSGHTALNWVEGVTLIVSSIGVAWLSWRFIEQPFRAMRPLPQEQAFSFSFGQQRKVVVYKPFLVGIGLILVCVLGSYALQEPNAWRYTQPLNPRNDELNSYLGQYTQASEENNLYELSLNAGNDRPILLLYGDSHAEAYVNALKQWANKKGMELKLIAGDGCPPLLGIVTNPKQYSCQRSRESFWRYLKSNKRVRTVFLAARWSVHLHTINGQNDFLLSDENETERNQSVVESRRLFKESLLRTLKAIPQSIRIVVAIDVPNVGSRRLQRLKNSKSLWAYSWSQTTTEGLSAPQGRCEGDIPCPDLIEFIRSTIADVSRTFKNVTVFDPAPYLCKNKRCFMEINGEILYKNGDHLNSYGSEYLAPYLPLGE